MDYKAYIEDKTLGMTDRQGILSAVERLVEQAVMKERKEIVDALVKQELEKVPYVNQETKDMIRVGWYKQFGVNE